MYAKGDKNASQKANEMAADSGLDDIHIPYPISHILHPTADYDSQPDRECQTHPGQPTTSGWQPKLEYFMGPRARWVRIWLKTTNEIYEISIDDGVCGNMKWNFKYVKDQGSTGCAVNRPCPCIRIPNEVLNLVIYFGPTAFFGCGVGGQGALQHG